MKSQLFIITALLSFLAVAARADDNPPTIQIAVDSFPQLNKWYEMHFVEGAGPFLVISQSRGQLVKVVAVDRVRTSWVQVTAPHPRRNSELLDAIREAKTQREPVGDGIFATRVVPNPSEVRRILKEEEDRDGDHVQTFWINLQFVHKATTVEPSDAAEDAN